MITYNHEPYITQAIESVLSQQTSFPFEIVVGDDCSTDGTSAILRALARDHPDRIRLLLRSQNIGAGRNYGDTLSHCRGEFVALLEGDDLWTSDLKLQRQCEFLDAHPSCSMCFHSATVIDERGHQISTRHGESEPASRVSMDALLQFNPITTCSAMYRRSLYPSVPEEVTRLRLQDWPTWMLLAARGDIAYLPGTWAAYRRHNAGIWSSLTYNEQQRRTVDFFHTIGVLLKREQHPSAPTWSLHAHIREKETLAHVIYSMVQTGRWREARALAFRYLFARPRPMWVPPLGQLAIYLRLLASLPSAPMITAARQLCGRQEL